MSKTYFKQCCYTIITLLLLTYISSANFYCYPYVLENGRFSQEIALYTSCLYLDKDVAFDYVTCMMKILYFYTISIHGNLFLRFFHNSELVFLMVTNGDVWLLSFTRFFQFFLNKIKNWKKVQHLYTQVQIFFLPLLLVINVFLYSLLVHTFIHNIIIVIKRCTNIIYRVRKQKTVNDGWTCIRKIESRRHDQYLANKKVWKN